MISKEAGFIRNGISINVIYSILILLSLSCTSFQSVTKYQGVWYGEVDDEGKTHHHIINIQNNQFHYYDTKNLIDSSYILKRNKILTESHSIAGKIRASRDNKKLQIKSLVDSNIHNGMLHRVESTQFVGNDKLYQKLATNNEWFIIIKEEGEYYCTLSIDEIEDMRKYEYSKVKLFRVDDTYFLANDNLRNKGYVTPISIIKDDYFELYSESEMGTLKVLWGAPK